MSDLIETITNVGTGFGCNLCIALVLYPSYFDAQLSQTIQVTCIFTAAALLRTYCVRKFFRKVDSR